VRIKSSMLQTDIALYHFMNRGLHWRGMVTFMRGITLFGEPSTAVAARVLALFLRYCPD